ncbi:MAG: hypothetical protein MUC63_07265 [Planctomycetes bacterium]|nr:hypothetical protein [Planctomycetota bacterium]
MEFRHTLVGRRGPLETGEGIPPRGRTVHAADRGRPSPVPHAPSLRAPPAGFRIPVLAALGLALLAAASPALAQETGPDPAPAGRDAGTPAAAPEPSPAEPAKAEAGAETPASPSSEAAPSWPWARKAEFSLSGRITERYVIRHADGDWDQDLVSALDLRARNLGRERLDLHLSTGIFLDTVGRQGRPHGRGGDCGRCHSDQRTVFYLKDVFDSYETPVQGRVYALFAEARGVTEGLDLRIGRQYVRKGETLHFDGLSFSYTPSPVFEVTAAGGLPVYFNEARWVTNFVFGAYVDVYPAAAFEGAPPRSTKLTLEVVHVYEGRGRLTDDYVSAQAWQTILGGAVSAYFKAGFLDGRTRDVVASATGRVPGLDLEARARFTAYPSAWGEMEDGERETLTTFFSPYLGILGEARPWRQFDASIGKQFGPLLGAEIGYSGRQPADRGEEGAFHHDFDRYYGSASVSDPFDAGMNATLGAEFWASDGPEEDHNHLTWFLDLSWKPSGAVSLSLGSRFLKSRVVFEPDSATRVSERTDVRVTSFAIDVKPSPWIRLGVRYELEADEGFVNRSFDTLVVKASFSF